MKIGQFVDAAVTAVNPDGSQATVPAGILMVSSDSAAITATIVADNTVKLQGTAAGAATVTFSAPGFKPVSLQFVVTDLPQLVVTLGPEQG